MKNNFFIFLATFIITGYSFAQNPNWILSPINHKLGFGNSTLPTYGPNNNNVYDGYDGQTPTNASNMIVDAQGEVKFFIIDDIIFDKNGYIISSLESYENTPVKGASEIVIVPNPNNCSQYYIITTEVDNSIYQKTPYIYLLDMSLLNENPPSNASCQFYGALVQLGVSTKGIAVKSIIPGFEFDDASPGKQSNIFIAASDLTSSNDRFVFISNGLGIYRLKIGTNGVTYDGPVLPFSSPTFNPYLSRSEMELVKLSNGNYRIACPYETQQVLTGNSINGTEIWQKLLTAELDPTGNLIGSSIKEFSFIVNNISSIPYYSSLKGIEFSDNGNYLYVTHSTNSSQPNQFEFYDFSNPTLNLRPINVSGGIDIQHSMLELGFNGDLYFSNANGLYKLLNTSNPSFPPFPTTPNVTLQIVSNISNTATFEDTNPLFSQDLKLYNLPDQIDGMNYTDFLLEGVQCCLSNKAYNIDYFNANGTQIWTSGGNPINGSSGVNVYIKNELRIPAGATITIQGMNLYFAPGARLVVENSTSPLGQGGRLILDGTTLSVDSGCDPNALWLGVEVWGNQTLTQGVWTNSSQGRLEMKNQSRIEHAWVGVLLSKRNVTYSPSDLCQSFPIVQPFSFVNARNGGIVRASGNSTFYNNQRGVQFKPYFGPGGVAGPNNLSYFYDVNFQWQGPLKQSSYQDHARLEEVKGIAFKGCDFENNTTPSYTSLPDGRGINATESQFYVTPLCNTIVPIGQPCPGEISNTFKNLKFGILTSNANLLSFTCDKSRFIDNQYGIHVTGTKAEKITSNDFAVRESDLFQTAGLAMYSSSEYKVENNMFYEYDNTTVATGSALSYGIVVNNSGPVQNEIYRNYFHDIKIGGQTERINGVQIDVNNNPVGALSIKGLTWKCNDFQRDVYQHDLTLMSARIHYLQGEPGGGSTLLETKQRVAGNKFSLTNEPFVLTHDIFVSDNSQRFKYSYIDAPRFMPDSYTSQNLVGGNLVNGTVQLEQALWGTPPMIITDPSGTCPSKLISKIPALTVALKSELNSEIDALKSLIDNGNTQGLISLISTASPGNSKNALLAASPYLSDEVILAYIAKNPPIGNLRQVLLANSHLSFDVKNALLNVNMPNGTRNQIAAAQNGFSERTRLMFEISYLQSVYDELFNEQFRDLLLDDSEQANFNALIQLLKEEGDEERLKLLLSSYIIVEDEVKANETRNQLLTVSSCPELNAITAIELNRINSLSTCMLLNADSTLVQELQYLKMNATDEIISKKAACMLRTIDEEFEPEMFLVASSALQLNNQSNAGSDLQVNNKFLMNVYPNPSSGILTVDFPELESGLFEINVLDINGRQIERYVSEGLSNAEVINLESLDKGIYFLEIHLNGQFVESHKVILK
ncbi:MAG: T9SS type A sorting domain-containing protein [Crocinitomicaceae bacterium]|nr:T9SS type A sorting domain-containing protein [Crocinitomicaceae bacterium]MCF8433849.1 T9SS type A sorting domain-containing protein [Crocinitomicaceae bacterium]